MSLKILLIFSLMFTIKLHLFIVLGLRFIEKSISNNGINRWKCSTIVRVLFSDFNGFYFILSSRSLSFPFIQSRWNQIIVFCNLKIENCWKWMIFTQHIAVVSSRLVFVGHDKQTMTETWQRSSSRFFLNFFSCSVLQLLLHIFF